MKSELELKQWCHTHDIKVIDSSKRCSRYTVDHSYFNNPDDYNYINQRFEYETEPLLVIEIPQSQLVKICEFEQQVFNNMREHGHYNLFETVMQQKQNEKRLRAKYPAVENAYKNYSLILKLAESGEL
jgi:uncharacterized protein YktA (UPF0223 family)